MRLEFKEIWIKEQVICIKIPRKCARELYKAGLTVKRTLAHAPRTCDFATSMSRIINFYRTGIFDCVVIYRPFIYLLTLHVAKAVNCGQRANFPICLGLSYFFPKIYYLIAFCIRIVIVSFLLSYLTKILQKILIVWFNLIDLVLVNSGLQCQVDWGIFSRVSNTFVGFNYYIALIFGWITLTILNIS